MPKVCIDPGHGANDPGAVYGKRLEKDDTLRLGLELARRFTARGWQTVMTRTEDARIVLAERTALANREKCDLYLACHRNSFSSPTANGAEIWLHSKAPQDYKDWAVDILVRLEALGFTNRGVKLGYAGGAGEYAVNRDTTMPSMLLELGFISSEKDNMLFDENLTGICDAIVQSCAKFLDYTYTPPGDSQPPPSTGKIYTLNLTKLREQGFTELSITL